VIIVEPQWKPSTEEQAIARAHRMGQVRTVQVHRLLARDSIDDDHHRRRLMLIPSPPASICESGFSSSSARTADPLHSTGPRPGGALALPRQEQGDVPRVAGPRTARSGSTADRGVVTLLNEAWTGPAWGLFLWLTMVTGCLRGNMCALRWTDLDPDRRQMSVERSHARTVGVLPACPTARTPLMRLGHGSGGATTLRFYAAWVAEVDHRAARRSRISCRGPTPPGRRPERRPRSSPPHCVSVAPSRAPSACYGRRD